MLSETNPPQADRKAGRTRLYITILLGLLTIAFIFNSSINTEMGYMSPQPNNGDEFIIGAYHDALDWNFQNLDTALGFNIWHYYNQYDEIGGKHYPHGWTTHDSLFSTTYIQDVQGKLSVISSHNMKALMERPKIAYLCYGQRSDYQCEQVSTGDDLWFYSFQEHVTGDSTTDSGQGVIHCRAPGSGPNHDDPGFVVRRLKANTEQSHRDNSNWAWRNDSECNWLIKPRIRIDSTIADNPANWDTMVCKIVVIGQSGTDTLKIVDIKVRNFLDGNLDYDGRYLEQYRIFPGDDTLIIHGDWVGANPPENTWNFVARGEHNPDHDYDNHADIQVWWYGICDMWIDYVRVDNDIADELLNPNNPNHVRDSLWLLWEAQDIACNGGDSPWRFYIELFEFNNIPCMKYVNRKLNEYSSGRFTLMSVLNYTTYNAHLPLINGFPQLSFDHVRRCYLDSVGSTELFAGSYALLGRDTTGFQAYLDSRIPNTLISVR